MNAGRQQSESRLSLHSRFGVMRTVANLRTFSRGSRFAGVAFLCLIAWLPAAAQEEGECVGFLEMEVGGPGLSRAEAVAAGDLDGDGDIDLVAVSSGDNRVTWFENDFVQNGSNPPNFQQRTISATAIGASAVEVADFDGDSHPDILVSNQGFDQVVLFRNSGATPPTFFEVSLSTDTPRPVSSRVLDFDADGDRDALVGAFGSGGVFLFENQLLQTGFGFERSTLTANVPGLRDFDVLDMNEELDPPTFDPMDLDLVAVSSFDNELLWLDSKPTTTTDEEGNDVEIVTYTPYTIASVQGPEAVRVVDVDGDGDEDLLVAASGENAVLWFERDGNIPNDPPDMDDPPNPGEEGDGAEEPEEPTLFQPNFIERVVDANAGGARSLFVGDLDNDGNVDFLVAHSLDDRVVWYEFDPPTMEVPGMGEGDPPVTEDPRFTSFEVATLSGPRSAIAAELNRNVGTVELPIPPGSDDRLEPVVASYKTTVPASETRVTAFESDGQDPPTFTPQTLAVGSLGALSMVSVDVNDDGRMDVVATDGLVVYWMENDGSPIPSWPVQIIDSEASGAESLQSFVEADGTLNLVTVLEDDGAVVLYERTSTDPVLFNTSRVVDGRGAPRAVVADFIDEGPDDTDRAIDLVVAFRDENQVVWFKGPDFTEEYLVKDGLPSVTVIDSGDIDGDGYTDIATGSQGNSSLAWHAQQPAETPGDAPTFSTNLLTSNDPDDLLVFQTRGVRSVEIGDVNGDGMLDILAASALDTTIAWYRNDGVPDEIPDDVPEGEIVPPTFTRFALTTTATGAEQATLVDVDDDGDLDVASVATLSNVIAWRENDGNMEEPTFTFHLLPTSGDRPLSLVVDDFDGDVDGNQDFFVGFRAGRSWFVQGDETCQDFDVNADNILDGTELAWLIQAFGRAVDDPPTQWWSVVDFNLDGTVDGRDLAVLSLFSVWGETTATCSYTCQ